MSDFYQSIQQMTRDARTDRAETQLLYVKKLIEDAAKQGNNHVSTNIDMYFKVKNELLAEGFKVYFKVLPKPNYLITWSLS